MLVDFRFAVIVLCFSAGQALFGQQDKAPPPEGGRAGRRDVRQFLGLGTPPDTAAAALGETLYASNCAFCHGAKANGAEAPDLIRSALVLHDEKGELIGPLVHGGRPDRGMPPFSSLTTDQLYDLAEFLHLRVELSANRGLYQLQNVVTGNADAGRTYFNGAGKCGSCHSVTGDLAHIGAKMPPADVQQSFLYPGAHGYDPANPTVTHVTVTLPAGQTVSGTLKSMDDFHVSLVDKAGEYHSFAMGLGTSVAVEDKLLAHRQLLDQYTDTDMHNLTAYLVTLK